MTLRSIVLGFLGAVLICGVTFINDRILRGTYLIGNNLPIAIYGLLIIVTVFVNPLLGRLGLTGKEIAVVLALTLAACTIPSSGLLRTFPGILLYPRHFEKTEPGWRGSSTSVRDADIEDLAGLLTALKSASAGPDGSPLRTVVQAFPARVREEIAQWAAGTPVDGPRAGLTAGLNAVVQSRDFARLGSLEQVPLSEHARWLLGRDREALTLAEVTILNRSILDGVLSGYLKPRTPAIIEDVPRHLMTDISGDEDTVLGGFIQGMAPPGGHVSPTQVPWRAWVRTLAFWVPLVLCTWGALLALSLIVHRQWSRNEHLPYPIATFTETLLPTSGSRPEIFRDRLFWVAAASVALIHFNNYGYQWFPDYLILIPTKIDLRPLGLQFAPTIARGGGAWLFNPTVYFVVIGIAFFIPTDVSLAFGLGPFFWTFLVGAMATYGISLDPPVEGTSWWMGLKPRSFVVFGSVLGIFLSLLYTGRRHYSSVFLRSLGLQRGDSAAPGDVWSCRAFLVLGTLLVGQLAWGAGVGLPLAAFYSAIMLISFVVTSRVVAETGLFHLQIAVFPCVILWGVLGTRAIGPESLLILQMVSMVLLIDTRETLMPFMANSLRVLELRRVPLTRATLACAAALLLGLGVGLPLTLYLQYDHGRTSDRWAEEMVPKMPFDNLVSVRNKMDSQGVLELPGARPKGLRVDETFPNTLCMWGLAGGLAVVLVFTAARLRYSWWPLHPLMFALWATGHVRHFAGAFLMGWAIKMAVTKYGGSQLYGRVKPLMIGLIAGEILGAVFPCVVGAIYYAFTGEPPKTFLVLPG